MPFRSVPDFMFPLARAVSILLMCMPFEWNQINSNWLLKLPNQYSKRELIEAFNLFEQELGKDFFESYDYFRGQCVIRARDFGIG